MWIIFQRDYRELRQTGAFRILFVISVLITVAGSIVLSIVLARQSWLADPSARPLLELILGILAYFLPLIILMAFIWAFAGMAVVQEKVHGNLDCLLATPLEPKEIWIGKSLAVFIPGLVISLGATFVILFLVNLTVIVPGTGEFLLPAPVLITGFVVNPILLLGLLSFIILYSMAGNPDAAIAPSFILGFGLMIGIPLGLGTGTIDLASWTFALWYAIGTVLAWILIACFSRLLTKEKVVLSGKGE